jgi:hypothetical protein
MSKLQSVEFTTVGAFSWTVPTGVYVVKVSMCGAGGGGGCSNGAAFCGTGGGSGEWCENERLAVTPGGTLTGTVGTGGAGSIVASGKGSNGTDTTCGPLTCKAGFGQNDNSVDQPAPSGGGAGGKAGGTFQNGSPGVRETHCFRGGGSGGSGRNVGTAVGYDGAGGPGRLGGIAGAQLGGGFSSGSGGASGRFGTGGNGGAGGQSAPNPPEGGFAGGTGAGGGGGGMKAFGALGVGFGAGGAGGDGYVLLQWTA